MTLLNLHPTRRGHSECSRDVRLVGLQRDLPSADVMPAQNLLCTPHSGRHDGRCPGCWVIAPATVAFITAPGGAGPDADTDDAT
jgi:hypothetical protein